MGLFSKKTWLPRIVPHPGRVRLLKVDNDLYDMVRADGTPIQAGDAFSDTNMNGFESRVENGFKEVESLFNTKIDKANIAHNLATTNPDMVLGADMGKQLNDSLTTIKNPLAGVNIAGNYVYSVGTDDKTKLRITLNGTVSHPRLFVFGDYDNYPIAFIITRADQKRLTDYGSVAYDMSANIITLNLREWSYVTIISNHACTIVSE